jgi:hypothetical protein
MEHYVRRALHAHYDRVNRTFCSHAGVKRCKSAKNYPPLNLPFTITGQQNAFAGL